jgi:hypothetical protein
MPVTSTSVSEENHGGILSFEPLQGLPLYGLVKRIKWKNNKNGKEKLIRIVVKGYEEKE